jgi:CubicO group peptidase (beta-lactamase class C family)
MFAPQQIAANQAGCAHPHRCQARSKEASARTPKWPSKTPGPLKAGGSPDRHAPRGERVLHTFLRALGLFFLACLPIMAIAQLPSVGAWTAAPDEWLLSNGQRWHHQTSSARPAGKLVFREPREAEKPLIDQAQRLFERSSAKAMALIDGNQVVWVAYKSPASSSSRFLSFSVGKTVTAMAVGKAICEGKLSLHGQVGQFVPELAGTDLGQATIEDLLKMSSGTWQGNPDSTIASAEQDQRIRSGSMNFLDLLSTSKVSTAEKNAEGHPRKPGEYFVYRSTDPLALGVALNKVTGTTYAKYVEREVLIPAGIGRSAIIGQDHAGFGTADGNVRLYLEDWIRFAIWVKSNQVGSGCFSDYVRKASTTQMANKSKKSGVSFGGYGYQTWTENFKRRDSYWAVGHGGQRIGWNHGNHRMLVAFSNVENYMVELYDLYAQWAAAGDTK